MTSDAIRCYELDSTSAGAAGIATVAAGSTVGFQPNIDLYHPGVRSISLSFLPLPDFQEHSTFLHT